MPKTKNQKNLKKKQRKDSANNMGMSEMITITHRKTSKNFPIIIGKIRSHSIVEELL